MPVDKVALSVFVFLFLLVTVLGFVAAGWRRADLAHLNEWGLGGRSFGSWITWFLLGGDLYTAYTFIAVPALVYASGAIGFFALPYTIIVYPLVFIVMPRLWSVAHRHGYVTPADFVRGRYSSSGLALAVALTGLLATMPYIALQLVGIQAVLTQLGVGSATGFGKDLPLVIAFAVLAAYTYKSGLRAPALIAFVKDILIYLTVLVAVIYIPIRVGGWHHIFATATAAIPKKASHGSVVLAPKQYLPYSTLALGSALALFMYPHSITGVLASRSRNVIRRNAAALPAYSFLLGIIALLGYMAIAAGIKVKDGTQAVPALFAKLFPSWFTGVAFAAIAIGALVPAAVMSIAAANLFTRNVYKAYMKRDATNADEARMAKIASLVVKVGALLFILFLPKQDAINFQLLGGVWILQTLPAIVFGLYTRWFHKGALLVGWLAGMVAGTLMPYSQPNPVLKNEHHFGTQVFPLHLGGHKYSVYAGLLALIVNLVVSSLLTPLFKRGAQQAAPDETDPDDYVADVVPDPSKSQLVPG